MYVKCIASDLEAYLKQSGLITCKIHSIFDEVINVIDVSGTMITLISQKKSMTPMCIQVDFTKFEVKRLVSDDPVYLSCERLEIPRIGLNTTFSQLPQWRADFDPRLLYIDLQRIIKCAKLIRETLIKFGDYAGLLPLIVTFDKLYGNFDEAALLEISPNTYSEFIEDVFVELIEQLYQENYERALSLIPKFIGFGPGLTPSTDDFLMGFITTKIYYASVNKSNLQSIEDFAQSMYRASLGRTTTVSENMLKSAAKGRVAQHYSVLVKAIFTRDSDELSSAALEVLKSGATSGTDFLFGVYCALTLILDCEN